MAKRVQIKVIAAKEKDSFEDQLNHFLSTLDVDDFIDIRFQESGVERGENRFFSALILFKAKRP